MYHQYQLVLKNTESESSFIWTLIKIGMAHRGARFEAYRRSLFLITIAVIHGAGFWAASGLSSRFIAGSNEVQTVASKCGWSREPSLGDLRNDADFEAANALVVMARYSYRKSAAYARQCYTKSGTSSDSITCDSHVEATLPYEVRYSESCPFDEKICKPKTKAITVGTGFIRSNDHLGINTDAKDSIIARKTLTCIPLDGEKYTDGWLPVPPDQNTSWGGTLIKGYKFGPVPGVPLNYTMAAHEHWLDFNGLGYDLA